MATLAAMTLAACGGGGGQNGSGPAVVSKLQNADNVAHFINGLTSSSTYLVAVLQLALSSDPSSCGTGSRTFTADTGTVNESDGTTVYDSCKNVQDRSSGGTISQQYNGKAVSKCTDGAQTADRCSAYALRFADGPTANTTLDFSGSQTGSSPRNLEIKVKGDVSFSETTDATVDFNSTISVNDSQGPVAGTGVLDNLRLVRSSPSNGSYTQSFNGGFSFTGSQPSCALGKVNVRTNTNLSYNNSESPTGGQITLSDSLGESARIDFNSDGSAIVTLSNGQTKSFTAAQLAVGC